MSNFRYLILFSQATLPYILLNIVFTRHDINYQNQNILGAGNDYNVDNNVKGWKLYLENMETISIDEATATKIEVETKFTFLL